MLFVGLLAGSLRQWKVLLQLFLIINRQLGLVETDTRAPGRGTRLDGRPDGLD